MFKQPCKRKMRMIGVVPKVLPFQFDPEIMDKTKEVGGIKLTYPPNPANINYRCGIVDQHSSDPASLRY